MKSLNMTYIATGTVSNSHDRKNMRTPGMVKNLSARVGHLAISLSLLQHPRAKGHGILLVSTG